MWKHSNYIFEKIGYKCRGIRLIIIIIIEAKWSDNQKEKEKKKIYIYIYIYIRNEGSLGGDETQRKRRDRERVVRSRGFETQKGEGEIKRELWDFRVSGHISNSIKPYLAMYRAVLDHIEKHLGILGRVEKKNCYKWACNHIQATCHVLMCPTRV